MRKAFVIITVLTGGFMLIRSGFWAAKVYGDSRREFDNLNTSTSPTPGHVSSETAN